jgi:hypothetical protein
MIELLINVLDRKNKDFSYGWQTKDAKIYGYVFLFGFYLTYFILICTRFFAPAIPIATLSMLLIASAIIFTLGTLYFTVVKKSLGVYFMYGRYFGSKRTYKGKKALIWGTYYIMLTCILTALVVFKIFS